MAAAALIATPPRFVAAANTTEFLAYLQVYGSLPNADLVLADPLRTFRFASIRSEAEAPILGRLSRLSRKPTSRQLVSST